MCGILFTSKDIENLENVIKFLKKRGPDHTEHKIINNYNFIHVLLSITGNDYTIQPFVYENIVILFNGEIYNYKEFGNFNSDGECIIKSYKKYGDKFIRYLEGEFAIILIDFNKDTLYYSTDIFSIKPLWVAQDNNEIGLCSYESSLKYLGFQNIKQVDANITVKMRLSTRTILLEQTVYDFDLNQHKTSFDDWNQAFENAVKKRTSGVKHGIFIGLSSGYDSGLISCVLNKLKIDYSAYTILGSEDSNIIDKRHSLLQNGEIIDMTHADFNKSKKYIQEHSEEYLLKIENGEKENYIKCLLLIDDFNKKYGNNMRARAIKNDYIKTLYVRRDTYLKQYQYRMTGQLVRQDNGSIGMSHICELARDKKQLIYLSGSGADEIISDYGFNGVKHYGHSTIGGKFPRDLHTVFPWKNFFGNTQRSYLMKEETVTGTWGIEGRYPFLDKDVVQEFLWLSHELKNQNYKSVIYNYLNTHNYPFELGIKVGFNCGFTGQISNHKKNNKTNDTINKTSVGNPKDGRNDLVVNLEETLKIRDYLKNNPEVNDYLNTLKN